MAFYAGLGKIFLMQKKILLIEDDSSLRNAIESFLNKLGYDVYSYEKAQQAIQDMTSDIDLILSDVMMPGLSGYDLLKYIKDKHPKIPVILMTAYGDVEKAVEAMKRGAYDLLIKPFNLNVLETTIHAAFVDHSQTNPNLFPQDSSAFLKLRRKDKTSESFLTQNEKMRDIVANLSRIASSKATVLIQGESGTGKEVIAKMIHEFSPRADRVFVAINCAAMPDSLLESELFGHEKGAFTGAISRQIGKFEYSNNGTILLDEISEMSLHMQTKLLRVIQESEVYRVGGVKPIPLNLRIICTTNRDLYQYTKEGHFREDLFYRINVIPVYLPPLRERGDDVIMMAKEFLKEFALLHNKEPLELDDQSKSKILAHPWYGNVREIRNAMERAVLVGHFDILSDSLLNDDRSRLDQSNDSDQEQLALQEDMTLDDVERQVILKTLDQLQGNRTRTAKKLGISLRTLRNKLKRYGVASKAAS